MQDASRSAAGPSAAALRAQLRSGFPSELGEEVEATARRMTVSISYGIHVDNRPGPVFIAGEKLLLPKRHGFIPRRRFLGLSARGARAETRSTICAAIASHSTNGFVRQASVRPLAKFGALWTMPYIVDLASDYVIEILAELDASMHLVDRDNLRRYVADNPAHLALTEARIHSYWNEYYRTTSRERALDSHPGFRILRALSDL